MDEPKPGPKDDGGGDAARWKANLFGIAVAIALIAGGVWLLNELADAIEYEKCVASRRRNCDRINLHSPGP